MGCSHCPPFLYCPRSLGAEVVLNRLRGGGKEVQVAWEVCSATGRTAGPLNWDNPTYSKRWALAVVLAVIRGNYHNHEFWVLRLYKVLPCIWAQESSPHTSNLGVISDFILQVRRWRLRSDLRSHISRKRRNKVIKSASFITKVHALSSRNDAKEDLEINQEDEPRYFHDYKSLILWMSYVNRPLIWRAYHVSVNEQLHS